MADRPPLKSYTFEGYYSDDPDESGPRTDCELAPDRETAIRLAAMSVLEDNEWTLASKGYESLEDFHDNEITVSYEWVEGTTGKVCPNCTSDNVRPSGKFFEQLGVNHEVLECKSCGYEHISLGFGARREELDREGWAKIDGLDAYEQQSLAHEEWAEMREAA